MELLYILTIFSLLGFIGVIGYLVSEKMKEDRKSEACELLEEKIGRLESYLYELEERLGVSSDEEKEKIIEMYIDGKELFVIENTLNIPRPKIEAVLKAYKSKAKEDIFG
ncbi:hypothetical protein MNB_SV-12-1371 [hydrothermal vent metagenome]|uniref:Uncharacterized protein n=1 Tax=hydrothermal vent metagenome TaxID=652676 RepID=A0A1W1CKT8_9ZZZZ